MPDTQKPQGLKSALKKRWLDRYSRRFLREESGATALEYSLMVLAIALVIIVAVELTGTNLRDGAYTAIGGVVSAP